MLSDPGEDTINVPLRILVKPSAYPHHPDSDRTAVTMAMFWRVVDYGIKKCSHIHMSVPHSTRTTVVNFQDMKDPITAAVGQR